jgi:hypothetical protein
MKSGGQEEAHFGVSRSIRPLRGQVFGFSKLAEPTPKNRTLDPFFQTPSTADSIKAWLMTVSCS